MKKVMRYVLASALCIMALSCRQNIEAVSEDGDLMAIPGEAFSASVYGAYNYDGAGSVFQYDKFATQTAVRRGSSKAFRLVDPGTGAWFELSSLPSEYIVGKKFKASVRYGGLEGLESGEEMDLYTAKVGTSLVWLVCKENKAGFVIEKEI